MNYTQSSVHYVFKNLWYIILLAIVPGVCLSGMADVAAMKEFYTNFFTGNLQEITWTQIFNAFSIYRFDFPAIFFSVFSFFAIVVCASMLLALIEKHMRIGKRTLNGLATKLNDNIISTCFVGFFYSLVYEIWTLLFSSLAFAVFAMIPVIALQYILFILLLIAGGLVLLYVVTLFYLWLPCLQITGFRTFEALRYSNQLIETEKHRLILSMLISVVLGNLFIIPAAIFLPDIVVYIVAFVVYLFYFLLFTVRMEVAYFDGAQLDREDLKKKY